MKVRYLVLPLGLFVAACEPTANGAAPGTPSAAGGGAIQVPAPVTLQTSGQDKCGAIDYKFLEGQPLATVYDLNMPGSTRYLGRTMKKDATNAGRMTVVVSTRSPQVAFYTPDAKVLNVYCG